ncbi:phosphonate ABC transporter ATP-binding protein [Facklamia sp. 7083-14-GEN3]|uniref:phosphonate ABC transporter ATP-binding protein n=1 Tax=Facklamia sp. 7083-14-GEN3 TaxID=2973478 RepID=UPI00215BD72E|nr:ATP-binding cassette domain-containing protein [Facklamia sp. 7083-14-GEN3]MCR8969911.1 ATP-binding cassette domain-containing protein [Facklamia sp. 7083-14-GEN3]
MIDKKIISLEQVTKQFGDLFALREISFEAREGERIALLGPSGSGKSTLMNLLTRTLQADQGKIELASQNIDKYVNQKEYAKLVGILRQQFDLVNNLSVINNVLVGRFNEWGTFKSLLSLFKTQDLKIAQLALKKVGMSDKINEMTANLSGGEQQRVAIARLLVQDPKIILADEPVSSLDPNNARIVLNLLNQLVREDQRTLIASMHSVDLSLEFFSRIIGIRGGRILFDKKTDEIEENILKELYEVKKDE